MNVMNRIPLFALIVLSSFSLIASCAQTRIPDTEEVSRRVRSILELPTFEHVYRDVIFLDRERSFLIFKTMDTEVLFAIDVRIQAGIDLRNGLSIERVRGGGLIVALPAPEILLADADESSIKQYFLKEVGGSISRLDYYDEINRKKTELIDDAIDRGILVRAEENARRLITSFLSSVGYTDVTFRNSRVPSP